MLNKTSHVPERFYVYSWRELVPRQPSTAARIAVQNTLLATCDLGENFYEVTAYNQFKHYQKLLTSNISEVTTTSNF